MEWYGPEDDTEDIALQARCRFALLWLSDKLGLLAAPEANWPHLPGRMHQSGMLYPEMSTEEWYTFMNEMSLHEIVLRHEALNIPDMTTNSVGFERVVIAGLSNFTFYIPSRILRQLGMSQNLNRVGVESFHIPAFTAQSMATKHRLKHRT
ncbi:hypothetical protein RHMOL_Rhmol11G0027000 [Rhododendron molle]|uniref:Uncharacterized protein n=1 Tax=Rhododendron molle TaxID=49168 RepID=A0ACC0LN71_RHOML|nr:hypothetical protein RHMOL_Rhmol11G0027000 [Rhododendron molle]